MNKNPVWERQFSKRFGSQMIGTQLHDTEMEGQSIFLPLWLLWFYQFVCIYDNSVTAALNYVMNNFTTSNATTDVALGVTVPGRNGE